jgi:ComF family protein
MAREYIDWMFSELLRQTAQKAVRAVPARCAVCAAWPSEPVCEDCVQRFAQPRPRCRTCSLCLDAPVAQCGECLRRPPPLDACFAAVSYGYPWADLVTDFKFGQQPAWAKTFATLMRSMPWVEPALEQADVVVPVPLWPARLAWRGFNQALQIARALEPAKARADLLLRIRDTQAQSTQGRRERDANLQGAFAVDPLQSHRVRGRRVVLVDDVMTTGATLFEAAQAMRTSGAAHITGIAFARTEQ